MKYEKLELRERFEEELEAIKEECAAKLLRHDQCTQLVVDQYLAAGCPSPKLGLRRKFEDAMQEYIDKNL